MIPVPLLLKFLDSLNKAFQRTGRVLCGEADSTRAGRPTKQIEDEIALNFVLLTHGSPAAVIGLERKQKQAGLPSLDFGLEIIEKSVTGLETVQDETQKDQLPAGYDAGVLMAWRDVGKLFDKQIDRIEITLNHRAEPVSKVFTAEGCQSIRRRITGPQTANRTVEGRLVMADFKEQGTRCRVHPSVGEPILCLFDEAQKDEVLENILQYVRIVGSAKENARTGRITSIQIHDIERLEGHEQDAEDVIPKGSPVGHDFWESPTLDELADSQQVGSANDCSSIIGTWPGEIDDGFEDAIDQLRHVAPTGGARR